MNPEAAAARRRDALRSSHPPSRPFQSGRRTPLALARKRAGGVEIGTTEAAGQTSPSVTGVADWLSALLACLLAVAASDLAWEAAHLSLYTLWRTGTTGEKLFAVVHCTLGDLLIALASLVLGLVLAGRRDWPFRQFGTVSALAMTSGLGYTAFREWRNIVVRESWAYSDLMPVVPMLGFEVGLSSPLQWIVVPTLALHAARRAGAPRRVPMASAGSGADTWWTSTQRSSSSVTTGQGCSLVLTRQPPPPPRHTAAPFPPRRPWHALRRSWDRASSPRFRPAGFRGCRREGSGTPRPRRWRGLSRPTPCRRPAPRSAGAEHRFHG